MFNYGYNSFQGFTFQGEAPSADVSFTARLRYMVEAGLLKIHATPIADAGPVMLFFDALGTHPGADEQEIFAGGAVIVQNGVTLATFEALAEEQFLDAPDWWQEYCRTDKSYAAAAAIARVGNNFTLNAAFRDVILWMWIECFKAFKPILPRLGVAGDQFIMIDDLVKLGLIHVVHSSLLQRIEESFFYRCAPGDDGLSREAFRSCGEARHRLAAFTHPYYLQKFSSMMAGMGYTPSLSDYAGKALNTSGTTKSPLTRAMHLATVFQAAKNRDSRLDDFRIKGW